MKRKTGKKRTKKGQKVRQMSLPADLSEAVSCKRGAR